MSPLVDFLLHEEKPLPTSSLRVKLRPRAQRETLAVAVAVVMWTVRGRREEEQQQETEEEVPQCTLSRDLTFTQQVLPSLPFSRFDSG